MLSALAAVGGSINKLPRNGSVTKAKGGRQNGSTYNVLVAVVLRCRGGNSQSNTAGIIGNFSGNRLDCVAVNYWHRFVLNLNTLGASRCVARLISKLPCNGGIAKAKGRWQNGGTRDVLVAVILRFRCGDSQCDAASIVGNFGGNRINLRTVNHWCRFI